MTFPAGSGVLGWGDYQPPLEPLPAPPEPTGPVTDCGITDTFTRSLATGWGNSDAGIAWRCLDWMSIDSAYHVDGTYGQFDPEAAQGPSGADGVIGLLGQAAISALGGSVEMLASFSVEDTTTTGFSYDRIGNPQFYIAGLATNVFGEYMNYRHGVDIWIDPENTGGDGNWMSANGYGGAHPGLDWALDLYPSTTWGTVWNLRVLWASDGYVRASLWPASELEPSAWQVEHGGGYSFPVSMDSFYIYHPNVGQSLRIHELDINGVNICS